jgi:hypothetical protein
MEGTGDPHIKQNKLDSEWEMPQFLSYLESRPIYTNKQKR